MKGVADSAFCGFVCAMCVSARPCSMPPWSPSLCWHWQVCSGKSWLACDDTDLPGHVSTPVQVAAPPGTANIVKGFEHTQPNHTLPLVYIRACQEAACPQSKPMSGHCLHSEGWDSLLANRLHVVQKLHKTACSSRSSAYTAIIDYCPCCTSLCVTNNSTDVFQHCS